MTIQISSSLHWILKMVNEISIKANRIEFPKWITRSLSQFMTMEYWMETPFGVLFFFLFSFVKWKRIKLCIRITITVSVSHSFLVPQSVMQVYIRLFFFPILHNNSIWYTRCKRFYHVFALQFHLRGTTIIIFLLIISKMYLFFLRIFFPWNFITMVNMRRFWSFLKKIPLPTLVPEESLTKYAHFLWMK